MTSAGIIMFKIFLGVIFDIYYLMHFYIGGRELLIGIVKPYLSSSEKYFRIRQTYINVLLIVYDPIKENFSLGWHVKRGLN